MLGGAEEIQPEPGYVGRFWTKLSLEQSWQERLSKAIREGFTRRRLIPALATASVLIIVGSVALNNYYQLRKTDQILASLSQDDLAMVENIELAENFELIEEMDFLEDLDIIENLDVFES